MRIARTLVSTILALVVSLIAAGPTVDLAAAAPGL